MDKMKKYGLGAWLGMVGAAFAFVSLIGFCAYGVIYDYFDTSIFLALVLAVISGVGMWNLLESISLSFAISLFFVNSFPVWADNINNITMYASRGGLEPVIALMVMMLAGIICAVIACFMGQKEENEL